MRKNRIISFCMALVMLAGAVPTTALAASTGSTANNTSIGQDIAQGAKTEYSTINSNTDTQTEVYLTADDSDLIVSVPTTIIVSGTPTTDGKYVGEYSVGVDGDMSGDKTVIIEPESTDVTIKQLGKNNKTATVTQNQTEFTSDDFANKKITNGKITAEGLTAGSWNGTFNFNIKYQQATYSYYSSIELAANDANKLTTANADVSEDNFDDAVAALFVVNDKATIRMLKDESNVDNVTLSQDTSINLATHTVTFDEGKYLTFEKNLTIDNGILNGTNSPSVVMGATTNTNNTLSINNITINQEVGAGVTASSLAVRVTVSNVYSNNLTINQTGDGNSAYNVVGLSTTNTDTTAISSHKNLTITENIKNVKRITGVQSGNITIDGSEINIVAEQGAVRGIYAGLNKDGNVVSVCNTNISVSTEQSGSQTTYGIDIAGTDILIQGCNIYSDNQKGNAMGLETENTQNTANIVIKDTDIYGKQWGLQTSAYDKATIDNCNVSSTNHSAYIAGSADIYNSTIKIANRENYQSSDLDECWGFYCGNNQKVTDNIVNIYNSTIGNPIDTSGVNVSAYGITAKYNSYSAPKEINVYNSTIYQGRTSILSFNASSPYLKNYTKFNLYDGTKLMSNSTTELDTEKVASDINWFNNPEITYRLCTDVTEDDGTSYCYYGTMISPHRLIDAHMYCRPDDPKSVAYEDYANVYDYR